MVEVPLLIGNTERQASTGSTFTRKNPITGEVVTRAAAATREDAADAVAAAYAAFPAWSAIGPSERRSRLLRAADLIEARGAEFANCMTAETGATASWAHFNVHLAAGMLREGAAMTSQISGEVIPSDVPENLAMAVRQPVGVVLGIAPWNAPVILGIRAVAMPLACGNTVVLKSSELCPATQYLLGVALREAGFGDGVVNVLSNDPADAASLVESLISNRAVRRINFTGSTRVGRIVAEIAARHLKPVLLELGGKAPLVILDDANIDDAVNAAAFGAFANQGQICMSTERILVDEKIADEFAQKFVSKAASLAWGDPSKGNVVLGSVVGSDAADRVRRLVKDAVTHGAKLLAGTNGEGTVMPAIVLDHVTPEMDIFREESFGPSVSITRFGTVEEAIRLANDTDFGLTAAVFGRDIARAINVARRIDTGMCHINGPTVHDEAQMPFGGVKASGYGRFGGKAAVDEFTELRWITIQIGPRRYPF